MTAPAYVTAEDVAAAFDVPAALAVAAAAFQPAGGSVLFRRPLFQVMPDAAEMCACAEFSERGVRLPDSLICSDTDAMRVPADAYDTPARFL